MIEKINHTNTLVSSQHSSAQTKSSTTNYSYVLFILLVEALVLHADLFVNNLVKQLTERQESPACQMNRNKAKGVWTEGQIKPPKWCCEKNQTYSHLKSFDTVLRYLSPKMSQTDSSWPKILHTLTVNKDYKIEVLFGHLNLKENFSNRKLAHLLSRRMTFFFLKKKGKKMQGKHLKQHLLYVPILKKENHKERCYG